jgi:hypothetical protein
MRPRTGAFLTIAAGLTVMILAASAEQRRETQAVAAQPPPAPRSEPSRQLKIDWQAVDRESRTPANQKASAGYARLLAANRTAMDKISIPVLLPSDPEWSANLRIFANGPNYSASSALPRMTLLITGSGRGFPLSPRAARDSDIAAHVPEDGLLVGQTESGIEIGFNRFGAAYSVALDCASGRAERRCADPAYLRGLVGRMIVLRPGGAP